MTDYPAAPPPVPAAAAPVPQNGMGVAALVMGIIQFFCFPLISAILAIVFGRIGMKRAEQGLSHQRWRCESRLLARHHRPDLVGDRHHRLDHRSGQQVGT